MPKMSFKYLTENIGKGGKSSLKRVYKVDNNSRVKKHVKIGKVLKNKLANSTKNILKGDKFQCT